MNSIRGRLNTHHLFTAFWLVVLLLFYSATVNAGDCDPVKLTRKHSAGQRSQSYESVCALPARLLTIVKPHIPASHELFYLVEGDLNRDQYPDILLALKHKQETSSENSSNFIDRPLLILVNNGKGAYRIAARNPKAIPCYTCGGMLGDPFRRIVVSKGYFNHRVCRWFGILPMEVIPHFSLRPEKTPLVFTPRGGHHLFS